MSIEPARVQRAHSGTEALMLAHGFTVERMVDLVRAGLATATAERMRAGSQPIAR